jgi:MHS family proline/betaine transporter-like MFS transporter
MHIQSDPGKIWKTIVSTVIGGTFEWFDFMVYSYFSSTIARVFFPSFDRSGSLLLTFATFAIGFLVRPIGGVVMGMVADRAGRVKVLSWIMVLMSVGSLLLGLTPGYATLGLAAPLLVLLHSAGLPVRHRTAGDRAGARFAHWAAGVAGRPAGARATACGTRDRYAAGELG